MNSIRRIIGVVLVFSILLTGSCTNNSKTGRPSFIIIQADDLGYCDIPLNGNQYVETPAIDRLANQAVVFTNFWVNPVCAPTRASLLTGRDFLLTGVSHVHGGKDYINLEEKTFADVFKAEGYKTGIWGKWHSGKSEGYFPWQRGFDEAYMADLYRHQNSSGLYNGERVEFNRWSDEVIADYAIDFIARNRDNPFVAYLSFLNCHAPLVAKQELVQKYRNKGLSEKLATLYAMIDQLDVQVNRVINAVDRLDLSDNTVILFMSDNGPAINNGLLSDEDRRIRNFSDLKGHKGNIWNNGVKSPLLIAFQGKLKHRNTNMLADVSDIFPTMAQLAGIDLSKYSLDITGKSFASNLLHENDKRPDKIVFNYADRGWPPSDEPWTAEGVKNEYAPVGDKLNNPYLKPEVQIISVQNERFKLLRNASMRENPINNAEGFALIDMKNDPFENENCMDKYPEEFSALNALLADKFEQVLQETHSFQPITFVLRKGAHCEVNLYAPVSITGNLKVAYNYSTPWNTVGMSANYKIHVIDSLKVKPIIQTIGTANNIDYQLIVDDVLVNAIEVNGNDIIFESLTLNPGVMILELKTLKSNNETEKMRRLVFQEL